MALRPKAIVDWTEPALDELGDIARYIHERYPGSTSLSDLRFNDL
jgi:hypothetical protein